MIYDTAAVHTDAPAKGYHRGGVRAGHPAEFKERLKRDLAAVYSLALADKIFDIVDYHLEHLGYEPRHKTNNKNFHFLLPFYRQFYSIV